MQLSFLFGFDDVALPGAPLRAERVAFSAAIF
jgi:hypothetical protein